MNKITLIIILSILSSSCSSLLKGQSQSVKLIDNRNEIYLVTCSGPAETMGVCYEKAHETCNRRLKVLSEKIGSTGIDRELKFQCIK